MNLTTPLSEVPRVGPIYQKRLKKFGVASVRDLLFYFPREYQDFSSFTPIKEIRENSEVCVTGKVLEIKEQRTFRKRLSLTQAVVADETGSVKAVWFNQPYLVQTIAQGDSLCLAGKVARGKEGIYLSNPTYEKIQAPSTKLQAIRELTHVGRIVPVYGETAGISSRWLRSVIKMVLERLEEFPETLPQTILKERRLLPFKQALWQIHFPDSPELARQARERFSFESLFHILLFILSERKKIASAKSPAIPQDIPLMKRFVEKLPFRLTDSQRKAAWQILKDLEKPRPMNRLLEGDVGSGKTVVAAMAVLAAAKQGFQTAWMAPTEILAQQHFKTLGQLLAPFKLTLGLVTGKTDRFVSPKLPREAIEISRQKLFRMAQAGTLDLLIGTHALIQGSKEEGTKKSKSLAFYSLGLVIVDEQHRFGVNQRAKLQDAASLRQTPPIPHFLSLTATPIPRTLAMTLYGDLDLSLLAELPAGRKQVITSVVRPKERENGYGFIKKQVREGRQVFVICPRIEKSEGGEAVQMKAVEEEYEKLSKKIFPEFKVEMLHGKMGARQKEEVMKRFGRGKIDVLVSTSVVEVGIDVPNATVMMIEGAGRFGLAQLHQFRGRVGRGEHQSYCFLFSESPSRKAYLRLKTLERSASGFELAEMDLRLRGPGDFTGTKQWGIPDFAMEQLTNLQLVQEAREAAKQLLEEDLTLAKYPALRAKVDELRERLHLE